MSWFGSLCDKHIVFSSMSLCLLLLKQFIVPVVLFLDAVVLFAARARSSHFQNYFDLSMYKCIFYIVPLGQGAHIPYEY